MKALLRRPSVWAFICIVLAGIFGPRLLGGSPSDTVGAPFARPAWLGASLSSSKTIELKCSGDRVSVLGAGFAESGGPKAENGSAEFD